MLRNFNGFFSNFCIVGLFLVTITGFAQPDPTSSTDQSIQKLYHTITPEQRQLTDRLYTISAYFLGRPYQLGPLGEGSNARYSQLPRYRLDAFDCLTFVETVMALALGQNLQEFKQCIDNIRYKNGQVDFVTRNHFTCLDWNINNASHGFVKDITQTVHNKRGQPIAVMASAVINKPQWYKKMPLDQIYLSPENKDEQAARLQALRQEGRQFKKQVATIAYLPFTTLFTKTGEANLYYFKQIPNGAIVEIVRPNWDLTKEIGTAQSVSHVGFVFWIDEQLIFRQASSIAHKIIDIPLVDYLKKYLDSPTVKGINLQQVLPIEHC